MGGGEGRAACSLKMFHIRVMSWMAVVLPLQFFVNDEEKRDKKCNKGLFGVSTSF